MPMKKRRHPTKCQCQRCAEIAAGATPAEATAKMRQFEETNLRTHGWFAHLVADDPDSPTGFNWHTHGLQEKYDHRDFQIVIPLPAPVVHRIGTTLANRVKAGEKFGSGQKLADVIEGGGRLAGQDLLVKLIAATECGRPVLRVILPDPSNKLDLGEINEQYAIQYADVAE